MRPWSRRLGALGSLVAGLLNACAGGDTSAPDCDAIAAVLVSRIEVRPATATVNLGDSLPMQAGAFSCAGPLDVGPIQWRSGDPAVATVGPTGLVTAVKSGQVIVYAAARGKEGSASLSTQPVPVARVTVEPVTATVGVGRTSTLTAQAFDAQDREIVGRPVTWSSANAAVVAVTPGGDITGATPGGPIAVTATIEGKSASSQVTLVLVPVNSVTVAPATSTIPAATSVTLTETLRDELGNVLGGRAVSWTSSDPATASVGGASGLVTGVKPGTATITATSEGKSGTAQVDVTVGVPAKLQFVQPPSTVQAGSPITPAVTVEIQDANGNRVTTAARAVTVTSVPSSPATLGGTLTVNAVNGVAGFDDLTVSAAGTYSLAVASTGLAGATSPSFVVTERPAARLAFVQQPAASVVAGNSLGTITVELQDVTGARVTGVPQRITLAIGANPGGGTLSGPLIQTTANGLATFTGLKINRSGTGYTLAASATGLTGSTSVAFDVTAGAASQLIFIGQPCPSSCVVGSALVPAPRVAVQDSLGNIVTAFTAPVAVTLLGQQGTASLGGTASVPAVAGVATFSNLTVSAISTGLTLRAAAGSLTPGVSTPFNVGNSGPRLVFLTQPPPVVAAGDTLPAVRVQLQDPLGGNLATAGVQVTLALGPTGTLNGTKTRATDPSGVATFSDLSVAATAGTNYAVTASAPTFIAAISSPFAVTAGAPSGLAFAQQPPASVTAGAPVTPVVTVQLLDAGGNPAPQAGLTVALTMSGGGVLTNASGATDPSGLATFTGLTAAATPGAGYTLTATASGLLSATSTSFAVLATVPTQLSFVQQPPASVTTGVPVSPAVTVQVLDGGGNPVSQPGIVVALAMSGGGVLTNASAATDPSGLATFTGLTPTTTPGPGYTLTATAPSLVAAVSRPFAVTAAAPSQLLFVQQPPAVVTVGAAVSPAVTVQLLDAAGNAVSQSGIAVTLTMSGGGVLTNAAATTNLSGLATFTGLTASATAGTGYTLTATSTGLGTPTGNAAVSSPFAVTAGAPSGLAFMLQPPGIVTAGAPVSPAVTVQLLDAAGNPAPRSGVAVALTMSGGGALKSASTTTNQSGLATFTGLTVTATAGVGYRLTANSTGFGPATSNSFAVIPPVPTQLGFLTQPDNNTRAGSAMSPAVQVEVLDANGVRVTTSTVTVTLTLGSNQNRANLTGNVVTASGGVAVFPNLKVSRSGTGYTLVATSPGLAGVTSVTFRIR